MHLILLQWFYYLLLLFCLNVDGVASISMRSASSPILNKKSVQVRVGITKSVNIGILFRAGEHDRTLIPIRSAISDNNYFYDNNNLVNFSIQEIDDNNLFSSTKKFCNLITLQNLAVILSLDPLHSAPIQTICSKLNLPYLQTKWIESALFLPNNISMSFYPDPETITRALTTIVKSLNWQSFIVLYEDLHSLERLRNVLEIKTYEEQNQKNFIIVRQLLGGNDQRPLLKELRNIGGFPIIIDCRPEKIAEIINQIRDMKLENYFNQFMLTSFDAHTVDFEDFGDLANITTIKLFDPNNEKLKVMHRNWETNEFRSRRVFDLAFSKIPTQLILIEDAVTSIIEAINHLSSNEIHTLKPMSCSDLQHHNQYGPQLLSLIKSHSQFEFDDMGNRTNVTIFIIDGNDRDVVGTWNSNQPQEVSLSRDEDERLKAFMRNIVNTTIIVSASLVAPYLMRKPPSKTGEVYEGKHRYHGYCRDLLQAIAEKVGFDFDIIINEDNHNGVFDPETETWNGVMGDILARRAQLGIGDMTITPEREEYVDFSLPFMKLGIDVIYKKIQPDIKLFAFLNPLTSAVWMYIACLLLFITGILYLVSRMAPGDWENPNPSDPEPKELENLWTMKNCLWLLLASVMNVGSDILPKGISSRFVASMWWLFTLVITNTYTASLAAYLSAGKPLEIKNLEDLAKQSKVSYGLMKDGTTEAFFANSLYSTYIRMYANMKLSEPSVFELSNAEGVRRVQTTKDGLYAFLMETTSIEYEVENNCDLQTPKKPIYPRSYGIAMPLNYPYRSNIDKALLELQENGTLTVLKFKWWTHNKTQCFDQQPGPELALQQVGGVFIVLGLGLAFSFLLGIADFLWNCHKISLKERLPYCEVLKAELKFAVNVLVTEKHCKTD